MQVDTALLLLLLLLLPFDDDTVDAAALSTPYGTRWLIAPTPSNPTSIDPQLYVSPA